VQQDDIPVVGCLSTLSTISFAGMGLPREGSVVRIDALAHDQITIS